MTRARKKDSSTCDARKEEGQKGASLMPHTKHQEGSARSRFCRDVACDVQVQRMYVGVTSCRHCQVDAHRDEEAGPKDTYNMWAEGSVLPTIYWTYLAYYSILLERGRAGFLVSM